MEAAGPVTTELACLYAGASPSGASFTFVAERGPIGEPIRAASETLGLPLRSPRGGEDG